MRFYKSIIFSASIKIILAAGTATNVIPGTVSAYNYEDYYDVSNSGPTIDGAKDVAYINNNEWLKYNVKNEKTSKYEISYVVSSNRAIPIDLELFLLIDPKDTSKDQMCVNNVQSGKYINDNFTSNDWKKYISLKSTNIFEISEGDHTIVMCIKKGEWTNIKAIEFKEVNNDTNTDDTEDTDNTTDDGDDEPVTIDFSGSQNFNYIDWSTHNKQITLNNVPFHVKGVNWYGFETTSLNLNGLDKRSMEDLVDWLVEQKFNAIRVPIAVYNVFNFDKHAEQCNPQFNDCSLTTKQVLQKLFKLTAEKGIVIMLDMHMRSILQLEDLWFGDDYSEQQFIDAWKTLLGIFKDEPNLFAIDLFNEPHGRAEWGGDGIYDWRRAATKIIEEIHYTYPDFDKLIFVEGLDSGKDFRKYSEYPLDFTYLSDDLDKRVVLSQHAYGPSVYYNPMWDEYNFPDNLAAKFGEYFQIESISGRASVVGEFGGHYTDKDKQWQDKFVDYLIENCAEDNFTWTLNPESRDTGGLLKDDYYTPETEKLGLLARLQPNPSKFTKPITHNSISVNYGKYTNEKCNY